MLTNYKYRKTNKGYSKGNECSRDKIKMQNLNKHLIKKKRKNFLDISIFLYQNINK